MDLELTDEQALLAESVQQLLAKSSGPAAWPALVDFGALALASDASGEVGAVELALVARAVGERLEAVPLIDTAAALYAARREAALPDGVISLALLEPGGSWALRQPATSLAGGRLDGHKATLHAGDA